MDRAAGPEYDLFISYSDADSAWVEGYLLDALTQAGVRCLSESAFELGTPRLLEFERAIHRSKRTLLVISSAYATDMFNQFTNLLAQSYGLETATWPVIPLLLEPTPLPPRLAVLTHLDATDSEQWPKIIERLCTSLQRPVPRPAPRPTCPYPGMVAFRESDSDRFFGREHEIQELIARLRLNPFLAVIGPSGSGKSSLVFAGLLPALAHTDLFGPGAWMVRTMRPGEAPLRALVDTLGVDLSVVRLSLADILASQANAQRLLLVVDQFEEIFTVAQSTKAPFYQALLNLMDTPNCYVVLTVRADFYANIMTSPLWRHIQAHRFEVIPLNANGLHQAIVRPAEKAGIFVEAALVERLIADAAGEPGVLPLIQETLVLLWERVERRFLPLSAYQALVLPRSAYGPSPTDDRTGLQVAMARRADSALAALAPVQQAIARRIFLRLIQFGEGRADTRRQQPVAALRTSGDDPALFDQTLRHLADNRLVTLSGEEQATDKKVDLAHEALITGWPQLLQWVALRREAEQIRRRLADKAAEWVRLGSSAGGLLDAAELPEAERWLNSAEAVDLGYDDSLSQLIQASKTALAEVEARQGRIARFRTVALAAIAILIMLALGVGLWSVQRDLANQRIFSEQQQAAAATSQTLARAEATARADADARRQESDRLRLISIAQALAVQAPRQYEQFKQSERSVLLARQAFLFNQRAQGQAINQIDESLRSVLNAPYFSYILRGHSGEVHTVAFSSDGQTLASGGFDGAIRIWNLRRPDLTPVVLRGHTGMVRAVAFSPDGQRLASGGSDQTVRLWDMRQLDAAPAKLKGLSEQINTLAFSPDGQKLAVGVGEESAIMQDNPVWLWNLRQPDAAPVQLRGATGGVNAVAFSHDGRKLAAVSYGEDGVQLWNLDQEANPPLGLNDNRSFVYAVAFSPNGTMLATGGFDGAVWLRTTEQPESGPTGMYGHDGWVYSVAFSPDGKLLASSSGDGTIRLWNPQRPDGDAVVLRGHVGPVRTVAFSADGKSLASGGDDGTVRLWRLNQGNAAPSILSGHDDQVSAVAFSPDGQTLAAGVGIQATHAKSAPVWIWDTRDASAPTLALKGRGIGVNSVAFSPDGQHVVASDFGRDPAWLWDLRRAGADPLELGTEQQRAQAVAFSPDGKVIATGGADGTLRLWSPNRPTTAVAELQGHDDAINAVAFGPDSQMVASGGADGTVRLWQVGGASATPTILREHEGAVLAVAFSPDDKTVASGGADGTVRLWQMDQLSVDPIVLRGHENAVNAITFSPDGQHVASGSDDRTVRIWATRTDVLAETVCDLVSRNLTQDEWRQFIGTGMPYERTCPDLPASTDEAQSAPTSAP